jgi:hypothetical protein
MFKITSYGKDLNGQEYIASVEGNKYPIYAVQFHPEMVSYTKIQNPGIPKSMEAVRISQIFSNFFIKQALLNNNSMDLEEMNKFDYINSFTKIPSPGANLATYYYHFYKDKKNIKRLK